MALLSPSSYPATTDRWRLNRRRLFEPLHEREGGRCRSHARLDEIDEVLRDLAVDGRSMVVGVVAEQDRPRLHDVHLMLHQSLLVQEHLMHLALGFVLADEPIAAKGVGVLLAGQPNDLGCLSLHALKLTWADLGMSDNFHEAHDFLLSLRGASRRSMFSTQGLKP